MPLRLVLEAVPNQTFTAQLESVPYALTFKKTRGIMSVSIDVAGVRAVSNSRVLSDFPLLPYPYLEGDTGNFLFTTERNEIPDFPSFEVTQFLYYLTAQEVADAR
jgi:hypothetical protein